MCTPLVCASAAHHAHTSARIQQVALYFGLGVGGQIAFIIVLAATGIKALIAGLKHGLCMPSWWQACTPLRVCTPYPDLAPRYDRNHAQACARFYGFVTRLKI